MKLPKCALNWRNDSTGTGVSSGPRSAMPMNAATSVRRTIGGTRDASLRSINTAGFMASMALSGSSGRRRLELEHQAFVHDLHAFDRDLVARCLEGGTFDLVDPAVFEVPAHDVLVRLVHEHDAAAVALVRAAGDARVPLPQGVVPRGASFEHHGSELAQARKLAHVVDWVGTFAIIDGVAVAGQAANLAERGHPEADELDAEIKSAKRIDAFVGRHIVLAVSLVCYLSASAVHNPMRMMT